MDEWDKDHLEKLKKRKDKISLRIIDFTLKCDCRGRQYIDTPVCSYCLGTGYRMSSITFEMLKELLK